MSTRKKSTPRRERRAAPRVDSRFPVTMRDGGQEVVVRTKNVSASGAYCSISRFIAPMTKLQIRLELPGRSRARQIACEGVVVRVEPSKPVPSKKRYHFAIFFHDMSDRNRALMAHYVAHRLRA